LHRSERRLEVRHVAFEPWFAAEREPPRVSWGLITHERAIGGLAEATWSLAAFTGADRVQVGRVSPASLRGPVRKAIDAMPSPLVTPPRFT